MHTDACTPTYMYTRKRIDRAGHMVLLLPYRVQGTDLHLQEMLTLQSIGEFAFEVFSTFPAEKLSLLSFLGFAWLMRKISKRGFESSHHDGKEIVIFLPVLS